LQGDDLLGEVAKVLEHHRVALKRIGGAEEATAAAEPALGHRLDHHVHVVAVVEMPMAEDDGVELGEVDLALGVLHHCARTGVEADVRVPVLYIQAAGRRELLGDHEPRTGRAHESELHGAVSATSESGTSTFSPK